MHDAHEDAREGLCHRGACDAQRARQATRHALENSEIQLSDRP